MLAERLLFAICYITATVNFTICNIVLNKNERHFVPIHILNANTIHSCMQLELRDLLTNEMKMCRICTSNVRRGSDEIVCDVNSLCGATVGECGTVPDSQCSMRGRPPPHRPHQSPETVYFHCDKYDWLPRSG